MDKLINALRSEPVRFRLYTLLVFVVVFLVSKGVVTASDASFIETLVGIALGVAGVETARAKVKPVA